MRKFRHPFRVPLCSYDGQGKVGDSFGFLVMGALDDL